MATTPQASGEVQLADPKTDAVESVAVEAGNESDPSLIPPGERVERTETFDAGVEELRRWWAGSETDIVSQLAELIRRRLGLAPLGPGAAMLAGLTGSAIRLLTAVLAAVLFGQWAGIPWGRWAVIIVLYGLVEAGWRLGGGPHDVPQRSGWSRTVADWTALLPTLNRESDLRELIDFTRRRLRPSAFAAAGVAIAALMLLVCVLSAPDALRELPAGSIVLLAWVLYGFGINPIYWGNLFNAALMARQARYNHYLFWASPADSPEVHTMMRKSTAQGFATGFWITVFFAWSVVLVGWGSPLVLPLAWGFVVVGYGSSIGLVISNRVGVRRIVERSRQQRLALFRSRIDAFAPRMVDLSPEESEQLRDLLFLHDKIRDAPATPTSTAHTAVRTAAGLLIPTVVFIITVFGEVSAERFLDAILP